MLSIASKVQLLWRQEFNFWMPVKDKQISGSRFAKWGFNHLLPIPYWGTFRWLGYKSGQKSNISNAAANGVDWISGAFLTVKRSAIEKAGMLDETFLYAEEVEWRSRLKKWGKLCLLVI